MASMLKFILCGASGVGKTSVILRFTKDSFLENINSTIGVDILVKKIQASNGEVYKLAITDTAGQERFKALSTLYFRGSKAIIFVYSIDSRASFDDVNDWIDSARQNCDNPNFVGCIIGNKLDLEAQRQVSYEEGLELAQRNNFMFLEVSAKAKLGIDEMFEDVFAQVLLQQQEIEQEKLFQQQMQFANNGLANEAENENNAQNVDLTATAPASGGQGGCC